MGDRERGPDYGWPRHCRVCGARHTDGFELGLTFEWRWGATIGVRLTLGWWGFRAGLDWM